MKTKVTIIGKQDNQSRLKSIVFSSVLLKDFQVKDTETKPREYKNIELICVNYSSYRDLMFAYDDDRSEGYLYLGHFNDGIVAEN